MLEWQWCGVRFRLSLLFPASVVFMLSLGDGDLTVTCLLASLIHECGHAAAMLLLRDAPHCITLSAFGMRVERSHNGRLGYLSLCAVSLAGPLSNALGALLLTSVAPMAGLVHTALCLFHLLPVASLDGGEALYALLCCALLEEQAERVLTLISWTVLVPMTLGGVWILIRGTRNFSLILLAGYLILQMFLRRGH